MVNKLIQTLGKHILDEITIRQLSIESNTPYTSTLRYIKENKDLFNIKKKGNIKLISLNILDNITKNYLIISERKECEEFIKKNPEYKILKDKDDNYSLILFGSRAEKKERKHSDIDLCIINKQNIDFSKFELLTKLEINPIFLKEEEFEAMLKSNEHNLAHEIIRKHIILNGQEHFWNLIWKNITKINPK